MRSATILDKSTDSNLVASRRSPASNSDPFQIRYKEVYNYVTAKRLFSLLEAFIDRSRSEAMPKIAYGLLQRKDLRLMLLDK